MAIETRDLSDPAGVYPHMAIGVDEQAGTYHMTREVLQHLLGMARLQGAEYALDDLGLSPADHAELRAAVQSSSAWGTVDDFLFG